MATIPHLRSSGSLDRDRPACQHPAGLHLNHPGPLLLPLGRSGRSPPDASRRCGCGAAVSVDQCGFVMFADNCMCHRADSGTSRPSGPTAGPPAWPAVGSIAPVHLGSTGLDRRRPCPGNGRGRERRVRSQSRMPSQPCTPCAAALAAGWCAKHWLSRLLSARPGSPRRRRVDYEVIQIRPRDYKPDNAPLAMRWSMPEMPEGRLVPSGREVSDEIRPCTARTAAASSSRVWPG